MQSLASPNTQPLRIYLRAVREEVLVTRQVFTDQNGSQGMLYLVSRDTDLNQAAADHGLPEKVGSGEVS